ncbi:cytochrome c biogenesis protein CcsA [Geotalea sp. SG265]|uniref:cytochrome c biogenesis protein CcsA n=1 Tax=Geotalea sp. SG265 TaxID=2922867 RepID=UPI001FAFE02F|nr:cytochrome c biogenesis protein CcsA [Geotalea sp. SG265]
MTGLITYQRVIFWGVIFLYLASWLPIMFGVIFDKERWIPMGVRLSIAGVALHLVWVAVRWVQVKHGPYINLYEVASSNSIIAMIIFLLAQWKYPKVRILGIFILPTVFLFMGFGALSVKDPVALSPMLDSSWLVVHVLTAKLTFGSYLISCVLAAAYIMKEKGRDSRLLRRFPVNPVNEELNRKFVTLGFLNHTVMLVSGSVWANVAFGSYWSWDPIETWSLISWLTYGIFYHLITIHGWKGNRMAWMSVAALGSVLFAFFCVPYIFVNSHNIFL